MSENLRTSRVVKPAWEKAGKLEINISIIANSKILVFALKQAVTLQILCCKYFLRLKNTANLRNSNKFLK